MLRWWWMFPVCAALASAGGLEAEMRDLQEDLADYAAFQPGLEKCFGMVEHKRTLQIRYVYELDECKAYLQRHSFLSSDIEELERVHFQIEDAGYPIPTGQGPVVILGRLQDGLSPAATLGDETIILMKRKYDPGYFCPETYSNFPVKLNFGAAISHELGHAKFVRNWIHSHPLALIGLSPRKNEIPAFIAESNKVAVEAENLWWKAGKTGIKRLAHNQARGCYIPVSVAIR